MTSFRPLALASVAALAALSLAACKKDTIVAKDESAEAVAKKVAASDIKPQPGRWESSMKFARMDMPGLPPEAREAMNRQLGATRTATTCLTPEEAKQPNAGFFQKGAENCKYDHFVMAGGKIDAAMTCTQQNAAIKTTMAGSYSETAYDIQVKSQGEMRSGMPMAVEMTVVARRVGDCTGNEGK